MIVVALLVAFTGLATYRFWPMTSLPAGAKADSVVVLKGNRELILYADGKLLKTYPVSLGGVPLGHKQREGDERTPEGKYRIDWRNPNSAFHLSLHISYPNSDDKARARERGANPGGDIMIHGIRNGFGWIGRLHRWIDWTNGCISVTNEEMREIWRAVPNGTPIEIRA
ncbi:MAG: L,D-transpeptidase family protein [Alphaproteobacteria bacterium]|nr:L,D-transpeptidase family protein [Alphaproteobacteria bacterium]